jgi:hypothetical protein
MSIYVMHNLFRLRFKAFAKEGQVNMRYFNIAYGHFSVQEWFIMTTDNIGIMEQDAIWIVRGNFIK